MSLAEQQLVNLCKKQIQQQLAFGSGNFNGYTRRDLEALSSYIEKKTGVIISLSTLKRVWREDYKQSPQLATLNALAMVLDYKDWQEFKIANQGNTNNLKDIVRRKVPAIVLAGAGIIVAFFLFSSITSSENWNEIDHDVTIHGPVRFEVAKTVTSGIPNTVVFKYDVSNVSADTFFIQQSWNRDHRVGINPDGHVLTRIYFESGYHKARLVANDSVIATQPIHILSDGWEPHIYYSESDPKPIDFKGDKFIANGMLHLDKAILTRRNIDFSRKFFSRITNSQTFGLHSDSFSFATRLKADSVFDELCPWMDVIIVTDVQTFMISWTARGCEKNAAYKLGEILKKGTTNDLSELGCDLYDWQEMELKVDNRDAVIYLNGKLAYRELYKQDFGKIVAFIYLFDGKGSIDYAKLKDGQGKVIFADDFNQ